MKESVECVEFDKNSKNTQIASVAYGHRFRLTPECLRASSRNLSQFDNSFYETLTPSEQRTSA